MRFGSLFSGIEAASVAWQPLGWRCAWVAEIDPFASALYGEARRIDAHEADQVRAYVQAAQQLIDARADYERQRREFVESHPALARFAPSPIPRTQALEEAEEAVAAAVKRGRL